MPMYNLIEYSDIYSKASRCLWQSYRDGQALDSANSITDFLADNNNSIPFKFKEKARKTGNHGTKDVKVMVLLKNLSNFWSQNRNSNITSLKSIYLEYILGFSPICN